MPHRPWAAGVHMLVASHIELCYILISIGTLSCISTQFLCYYVLTIISFQTAGEIFM